MALVWTCEEGREGEAANGLLGQNRIPTCQTGYSQWQPYESPGVPIMDLITMGVIIGCAILFAVGFTAGEQR